MSYKPDNYTSLSPYLIVQDAEATLRFAETVFDADRLRIIPSKDGGGIMHAEAKIDDSVLMMGESPGGPPGHVHVYVSDVDAAFERAKQAGGSVVQEPMQKDGEDDKRGGIDDGHGTTWWISQQLS